MICESFPDEAIKISKIEPKKAKLEEDNNSLGSLEDMFSEDDGFKYQKP